MTHGTTQVSPMASKSVSLSISLHTSPQLNTIVARNFDEFFLYARLFDVWIWWAHGRAITIIITIVADGVHGIVDYLSGQLGPKKSTGKRCGAFIWLSSYINARIAYTRSRSTSLIRISHAMAYFA